MMQYDWEQMSARERDLLVAERVMELSQEEMKFKWPATCNYSTDISDAWEVVEKLRHNEEHLIVESFPSGYLVHDVLSRVSVMNQNVAEAICLAALRAKGVDV